MKGGKVFTIEIIDYYQVQFRFPFEKNPTFLKREKFPTSTFSPLEPQAPVWGHSFPRGGAVPRQEGEEGEEGEPFPRRARPTRGRSRSRSLSSCAP